MSVTVTLAVGTDFSTRHIKTASRFTQKAWSMEQMRRNTTWNGQDAEEYQSFCLSGILSAWFFLEGAINFFYQNLVNNGGDKRLDDVIDAGARQTLATMWSLDLITGTSPLPKFNIALQVCGKEVFDKGRAPYQLVDTLQRFRNFFAHYKADFFVVGGVASDLEQKLVSAGFATVPFTGHDHFPVKYISHGCAEWAVNTAVEFVDEFYRRLGVAPYHEHVRGELNTR